MKFKFLPSFLFLLLVATSANAELLYSISVMSHNGEVEEGHTFSFTQTTFPGGLVFGPLTAEAFANYNGTHEIPTLLTPISGNVVPLPAHQLRFPMTWVNTHNNHAELVSNSVEYRYAEVPSLMVELASALPELPHECRVINGTIAEVETNVEVPAQTIMTMPVMSDLELPAGIGFDVAYETTEIKSIPVSSFNTIALNICKLPQNLKGNISFSFQFKPASVYNSETGWDYSGSINWLAVEGDNGTLSGQIHASEITSNAHGELDNVVTHVPPLAANFSRQGDNLIVDFSPTAGPFPNFMMNFTLQGKSVEQPFSNLFAIAIGQIARNRPGSTPRSISLPITPEGMPSQIDASIGSHVLLIETDVTLVDPE